MTCPIAESLLLRYAERPEAIDPAGRAQIEQHLSGCAACRAALEDQREIAALLRAAPHPEPPADFRARLAARLDAEPSGWLALADWRAWTAALAPAAAALALVAWLAGAPANEPAAPAADTFEALAGAEAGGEAVAPLLRSSADDLLLETVLTGSAADSGGQDVR